MKFIKDLIGFLKNVANDERIPDRDKKMLLALIAFIISPLDLIPDWLPVVGQLDDFIALSIIMDYFFRVLDDRVLLSHWPWGMKSFVQVRGIARFMQYFVPGFVKKRMWSYVGDPY